METPNNINKCKGQERAYTELNDDCSSGNEAATAPTPDLSKNKLTKRDKSERWSNRVEFLLSLVGLAVGFGNLWRFSYYCQKNGGGTFLFPYLFMLVTLGIPIFYLELLIGKVSQVGPLHTLYRLVPPLGGIGISMILLMFFTGGYYMLLIAYVLFYIFASFQNPPAWGSTFCGVNTSIPRNLLPLASQTCLNESSRFFYYQSVTRASSSIGELGEFNWRIYLLLFASWLILYLCTFNGIKTSGKVVYVTAILPYVVLTIMFFRAITLPGAGDGLLELFTPRIESLYSPQVWLEAGGQIFFSLGLGFGGNILLASHLDQNTSVFGDAIFVSIVNSLTSIFASIVVFSILGYQSFILGTDVRDVIGGPGLVFIAFASALLEMPLSPLWSVLFFLMMLSLGLDSMFAAIESMVQALLTFPYIKKLHKSIISAILCATFFVLSIQFAFGNGLYIFQLIDQFSGSLTIFLLAFFELIGISWFYGVNKIFNWKTHDYQPTGRQYFRSIRENRLFRSFSLWVWRTMWIVVCPVVMIIIFVGSSVSQLMHTLRYTRFSNLTEIETPYPVWGSFLGAMIIILSNAPVLIFFIYKFNWKSTSKYLQRFNFRKYSPPVHWKRNEDPLLEELESVSEIDIDTD